MLPDPDETLRYLVREAGLDPGSSLADLKRDWARTATAVKRSQDASLQHSWKRAREDQDERGTRPEAWVHIKKATRRKTHSLENMPLNGELILGKREYLQLVFEQRQRIQGFRFCVSHCTKRQALFQTYVDELPAAVHAEPAKGYVQPRLSFAVKFKKARGRVLTFDKGHLHIDILWYRRKMCSPSVWSSKPRRLRVA